ncbi:hypothetical protein BTVI_104321 [Pitangus sulphuratus]|nr:hypothetical protein BTVI_104321 [Pitangus sulphuratus]
MPRKLDDIQGSPPPSSRTFHSKEQGVRQKGQEASRDGKRDPGKTQTQKVYKRNTYKRKWEQYQMDSAGALLANFKCTFYLVNSIVVEIVAISKKESEVDHYSKHYQTWSDLQIKTESSGKEIQRWTYFKIILNFTVKEGETDPGTPKPKSSITKCKIDAAKTKGSSAGEKFKTQKRMFAGPESSAFLLRLKMLISKLRLLALGV